ncbi:toll/interleukin-1 receptor domain-containing protein [Actinosynnema sp. CS-041913]|uniref:toll/interleukin-1 receptor domain-containing protein n=1 Tax=Actinosynnema sp. CS-041913 TaxID=3239917 RepID=UPI003D8E72C0
MADNEAKHVFVSYVSEDLDRVRKLCALLEAADVPYWQDRRSLAPGDHWKRRIRDAIRSDSLVFLACFSDNSRTKARSYMNEELNLAVEEFRLRPPGAPWLVPVRFDDGEVPDWDLGGGRTLHDLNFVDLFGEEYAANAVRLTTTITNLIGAVKLDARTVRAAVAEAGDAERPAVLQRLTREMVLAPERRIELDELVSQETQRVLVAMRDEERFLPYQEPMWHQPEPVQGAKIVSPYASALREARIVRSAELVADYARLVRPLCAALQVAARWAEVRDLAAWVSALRAITAEARKPTDAPFALRRLRHVPALLLTFTAALAASGQQRWDNFKVLLVDLKVPVYWNGDSEPYFQANNPTVPFGSITDEDELVSSVVARSALTGVDARRALAELTEPPAATDPMPIAVSDWLHVLLRQEFAEQYVDDQIYDDAFDRAEVLLGLLSQDRAQTGPSIGSSTRWYGRSARRGWSHGGAYSEIKAELEAERAGWPPTRAGLFGGEPDRALAAIAGYKSTFRIYGRP